ncbi:MAG: ribonuclease H-like domain-containing protein [archaeon]
MTYFVIDVETIPLDMQLHASLSEEDRKKLLNPIDSRIIAIGLRTKGKNIIFQGEDEQALLFDFWKLWKELKPNMLVRVVGFNLVDFDIPFLVARSFINDVAIVPFSVKELLDLRDKINAYRYGHSRGKLKEYAVLLGLPVMDVDGSDVARLWQDGQHELIRAYLERDLEITDALYLRAVRLGIADISRF